MEFIRKNKKKFYTLGAILYPFLFRMVAFATNTGEGAIKNMASWGLAIVVALGAIVALVGLVMAAMALIKKQPHELPTAGLVFAAGALLAGGSAVIAAITGISIGS